MGHGHSSSAGRRPASPTYRTWHAMRRRCLWKRHTHYHRYGGRGITVDPRWNSFQAFLDDMGERPEGTSLERKDNDQGYSKDNCFWATAREQANNRCNSRLLTYGGKTQTLAAWAREKGMTRTTLADRIDKHGWSLEEALTLKPSYSNKTVRGK